MHFISPAQIRHFLSRLFVSTVVVGAVFVLTQDFHIFPGVLDSLVLRFKDKAADFIPDHVIDQYVQTKDGESLNVWALPASSKYTGPKRVAIMVHGNAGTVLTFFDTQAWLSSLGFTTYSFDYRGFGRSSGWPSEDGLYQDVEAVWEFAKSREAIGPESLAVVGISVGTGPAAYLADRVKARALTLVSPYSSMPDLVSGMLGVGYLAPFLWYNLPTKDFVASMIDTCVVATHGIKDTLIPVTHSEVIKAYYRGHKKFTAIINPLANHFDILGRTQAETRDAMLGCFS